MEAKAEPVPEKAKLPTEPSPEAYNLSKVPEKPDTEDRDKYGRNAKGQYLNHQAFVSHRNLLNEEEAKNGHVWDIIQDKLTDADYLTQVMDPNGQKVGEAPEADAPHIDDNV
jgi:hypothetical protein